MSKKKKEEVKQIDWSKTYFNAEVLAGPWIYKHGSSRKKSQSLRVDQLVEKYKEKGLHTRLLRFSNGKEKIYVVLAEHLQEIFDAHRLKFDAEESSKFLWQHPEDKENWLDYENIGYGAGKQVRHVLRLPKIHPPIKARPTARRHGPVLDTSTVGDSSADPSGAELCDSRDEQAGEVDGDSNEKIMARDSMESGDDQGIRSGEVVEPKEEISQIEQLLTDEMVLRMLAVNEDRWPMLRPILEYADRQRDIRKIVFDKKKSGIWIEGENIVRLPGHHGDEIEYRIDPWEAFDLVTGGQTERCRQLRRLLKSLMKKDTETKTKSQPQFDPNAFGEVVANAIKVGLQGAFAAIPGAVQAQIQPVENRVRTLEEHEADEIILHSFADMREVFATHEEIARCFPGLQKHRAAEMVIAAGAVRKTVKIVTNEGTHRIDVCLKDGIMTYIEEAKKSFKFVKECDEVYKFTSDLLRKAKSFHIHKLCFNDLRTRDFWEPYILRAGFKIVRNYDEATKEPTLEELKK